jgi:UDPglucose 6-dehydrogenase
MSAARGNGGAVGVVGAGYVGLVTAACFADLGHDVVCCDVNPERIEALLAGRVPIYEPGVESLLERNAARLAFTLELAEVLQRCRIVFVCVDTPPTASGDADLSRVDAVVAGIPHTETRHVLVMKSTVPVGTGEKVRLELLARGLDGIGYVSNPEFLREGRALADFMEPDRIVIGAFEEADGQAVADLYADIEAAVIRTDVASAEMIKYGSNAFLATKISFINEIANVCEEVGADVSVVANGMGLDERIGPHFLRPGIGFGGSCLIGEETVLVREHGAARLLELRDLFGRLAARSPLEDRDAIYPEAVEVLAWRPGERPRFMRVAAATRRRWSGEVVRIRTKMGRSVTCTPDHPLVAFDRDGRGPAVVLADDLNPDYWLPLAQGAEADRDGFDDGDAHEVLSGTAAAGLRPSNLIARLPGDQVVPLAGAHARVAAAAVLDSHPRSGQVRLNDILRSGTLRADEAYALALGLERAAVGTARNGTYVPTLVDLDDPAFWRIVGLYLAEGSCSRDGDRVRLSWSFHPTDEHHLVEEVVGYWRALGVKTSIHHAPTSTHVRVSSRILAGWWTGTLGLGQNCYEQRVPDLIWGRPAEPKLALLSGLWEGDGSWSRIGGGPSVVLEMGTTSGELADGVLRLLGDLEVTARHKVGRTAKSTVDTHWIVIAGADQVEHMLALVGEGDRGEVQASIDAQAKRIAPTGYRRFDTGAALVRVVDVERRPYDGWVYSLEVPDAGTFVTTGGLIVHNCFPKDVNALKQLAGNSGYHFQLLTAVIEVNELQKRRVVGKLEKHLGSLRGRRIAMLGLAFKANTDDMREASSIVLAARLRSEGAVVVAYDPVAMEKARTVIGDGVELAGSILEAVSGADAAVIVTEWGEFRHLATRAVREAMATPLIVDGRNLLDPRQARAAGFAYESVGRPADPADVLRIAADRADAVS